VRQGVNATPKKRPDPEMSIVGCLTLFSAPIIHRHPDPFAVDAPAHEGVASEERLCGVQGGEGCAGREDCCQGSGKGHCRHQSADCPQAG